VRIPARQGSDFADIRVLHKDSVKDQVIEGAFTLLDTFEQTNAQHDSMKALPLNAGEQQAFANAALELRYDTSLAPAPVTETQILRAHHMEDRADDLWTTQRVRESFFKGGLRCRNANGKRVTTRAVDVGRSHLGQAGKGLGPADMNPRSDAMHERFQNI